MGGKPRRKPVEMITLVGETEAWVAPVEWDGVFKVQMFGDKPYQAINSRWDKKAWDSSQGAIAHICPEKAKQLGVSRIRSAKKVLVRFYTRGRRST